AFRESAAWVNRQPWPQPGICAANYPHLLTLLTRRPAVVLPRFRDTGQALRFLDRYHPGVVIVAVDEPAEARVGDVLLERPWMSRRVRPELAGRLEVALVERRRRSQRIQEQGAGRQRTSEQWLLVLKARRKGWRSSGRGS